MDQIRTTEIRAVGYRWTAVPEGFGWTAWIARKIDGDEETVAVLTIRDGQDPIEWLQTEMLLPLICGALAEFRK